MILDTIYQKLEVPILKFITYDIGKLQYRISDIEVLYLQYRRSPEATYDHIEGFIRYRTTTSCRKLRYHSFEHDIVVSYDIGIYEIVENHDIGGGTGKFPDILQA